ncbi:MAG: pyridoxamine 5'-phosphate oxidase family protein [Isosphaeraceae bacterium]
MVPLWFPRLLDALASNHDQPGFRQAQLATVRGDGRPANRTVVVRNVDESSGGLWISTDSRSAKVEQLEQTGWAELCWYFSGSREQFRLLGRVRVVGPEAPSADRTAAWKLLPNASRLTFFGPAPGTNYEPVASAEPPNLQSPPQNFVVLILDPEVVEHLDLKPTPHVRTRWNAEGSEWCFERLHP